MQDLSRKNILFLYSSVGGAHRSVANAIATMIQQSYPGQFNLQLAEVFTTQEFFPLNLVFNLYPQFLIHHPAVWRIVYHITNGRLRFKIMEKIATPLIRPKLCQLLLTTKPDAIVSTIHSIDNFVTEALKGLGWGIPFITIVVDLVNIHTAWAAPGADWYVVHTEAAKKACIKYGIESERIRVYGLPVNPEFCQQGASKREIRTRMGLKADLFTVLILGGAEGAGNILDTALALSKAHLPIQMIVVTGRNEALQGKFNQIEFGTPTKVYGFVDKMPELMRAADITVTKAGPGTIVEALNSNLPIIITNALPGQEEGNVDYVVRNQVGWMVKGHKDLSRAAQRLIEDRDEYERLVRNAQRVSKPDAAIKTAELIASIVTDE